MHFDTFGLCGHLGIKAQIRYMGLIWSLFLVGHLQFEWFMTRFIARNTHHKKHTCHNQIELCAQNRLTVLKSICNIIGGAYVIIKKRKRVFTLTFQYIPFISILVLGLKTCVIHNCQPTKTSLNPMQQSYLIIRWLLDIIYF